ncbi:MutS-like protein [Keratinibaculum paraultunense]|uniref:MutS-like protein n=1 Tax=Keratinibaculum paraultunense TaxID=1278232 RepID=A0A4V2UU23_9FIRM|nr:DNA mismatch repair protein MutS [Keratinibaculum paraultunense]QQY79912.1 DNA mismatch repair protein MutS [Keratinibaculum paraultunense]TCS88803.1 MutS-like protein [Keratinibaculum paraultunense]
MEFMDPSTEKALDFQYILNKINTKTPYGKIYKRNMRAFLPGEEEKLIEELNKVESYIPFVKDKQFMKQIDHIFGHIKDLRTSIRKANNGGILSEVELFEIKNFLYLVKDLYHLLKKQKLPSWSDIKIQPIDKLEKYLDPEDTGLSTFYIYDSYSEELRKIRQYKREVEREIKREKRYLKKRIEEDLNIKLRPDGTIILPKDDKKLIEKIENHPHLAYVSETYINIKYSIKPTDNMTLLERQYLILKDKEEREEYRIREELSKQVGRRSKDLFRNIASIGKIDFILGKAIFAIEINGIKPNIISDHMIKIVEGRHPKIEEILKEKGLNFTPITIELKEGVSCITGPNMGGKTVSLQLVGLLTAMAQHGLMVPAKEMTLGLNQFIKTSIGDPQSMDKGLSTFGGEIKLIQEAIERCNERGLILIDELARGTNPEEGYAISRAIVEYLIDKNCITLLTTHYDNIGNIEDVIHFQVVGLSNVDLGKLKLQLQDIEDEIDAINKYMDYRLKRVDDETKVPKEAINIASIMGLNKEIISKSEKYLGQ